MAAQPANKILTEAAATITSRVVEYDTKAGERTMGHAAEIFNVVKRDKTLTMSESDAWLFMMCLKLARSRVGKPKLDTYVDMSAYAALLGECELETRVQASELPQA